jgi:hypothetical protein
LTFRVKIPHLEQLENFLDLYTSREWKDGDWRERELTSGNNELLSRSYVNYLNECGAMDIFLSMIYHDEQKEVSKDVLKDHLLKSDANFWMLYGAVKETAYQNSKAR